MSVITIMTKKDFDLIASVLKDNALGQILGSHRVVSEANTMLENIKQGLCDALASKNPRFQKEKFLKACGIDNIIVLDRDDTRNKNTKYIKTPWAKI